MLKKDYKLYILLFMLLILALATGCSSQKENSNPVNHLGDNSANNNEYDINQKGIPKFVHTNYIELSRIQKISEFRSSAGHNYSDTFENGRSMKHYFWPYGGDPGQVSTSTWNTINIFSPVQGKVNRIIEEWAGTQVWIQSNEQPAFIFIIFHINLANPLVVGNAIAEGQLLGNHIGSQTMSDIAVGVNTTTGWKLVSYFDVMTDLLFQTFQVRGINYRSDAIISKQARDADPLSLNGEAFISLGHIDPWVILN